MLTDDERVRTILYPARSPGEPLAAYRNRRKHAGYIARSLATPPPNVTHQERPVPQMRPIVAGIGLAWPRSWDCIYPLSIFSLNWKYNP